jgi:hypothetical protein
MCTDFIRKSGGYAAWFCERERTTLGADPSAAWQSFNTALIVKFCFDAIIFVSTEPTGFFVAEFMERTIDSAASST